MTSNAGEVYRRLFESGPRPVYVSDRETLRFLHVNDAACRLYGWSRDEMLAMTLRDIRPPEEVPAFERAFADATKNPLPRYARHARHRTKTGDILDVTLEIVSIEIDGRTAALATVTNLTGIDHAERRFRLLVENSADGISLTREDNTIEYMSPGGQRILGYGPDDIAGASALAIAHPDDIARWVPPAPGETRHNVARIRHRDGSWRWIESSTRNLTHDPAVRAFVTNYRDITERKEAERALVESQQRLEFLLSATSAITYSARPHGDFATTFMSSNVEVVLGWTPEDFYTSASFWPDNIHPDDRAGVLAEIPDLVARGSGTMQYRFRCRDGRYRWMRDGARVIRDANGVPLEIVGYWTDVTDHVEAVAERDAMFARVAMADRMLSIGTLAAGVAHEINNPLAYVAANLELLAAELPHLETTHRSRLTDATLATLVNDARDGVARVSAIVRDLRAVSRQDAGHGPVDITEVLASSIKLAGNEIRHRGRVVETRDPVPLVEGDARRLGQVFLNLLINAAQALPEGQADRQEIRVRVSATDDGRVRVDVSDTGVGISPAIIDRIFDPFFTTKPAGAGTGLGLAISHQIVRSLGGELLVDSALGRGSTFSVILPVAAAPRAAAPRPAPAPAPTSRVLLIDDEPAVGRSVQLLLAPETEVVTELHAQDGLARLARGERYDAIVCDLMMPQRTGMEVYAEIEKLAPECLPRLIFVTGGAFTPQAREFLERVGRPHLEKPFTEAELRRAIAQVAR